MVYLNLSRVFALVTSSLYRLPPYHVDTVQHASAGTDLNEGNEGQCELAIIPICTQVSPYVFQNFPSRRLSISSIFNSAFS